MKLAGFVVIVLTGLAAMSALAKAESASLPDIEDEVMCPTCGVPLEHAFSPQAERERDFIRAEIEKGKTKQQIKDDLVSQFGPAVLAVPSDKGFDLTAYVVPIVVVIAALVALLLGLFELRRRSRAADGPPVRPLPKEDADRLESDLSRYDL